MPFTIPNEADAGHRDQAEPDSVDIDILVSGIKGDGVLDGCAVTAQGSPDMTVAVASGNVQIDGVSIAVTAGNVTIAASDASHPRFDLIIVDNTGAKARLPGVTGSNPTFPTPAADTVVLASIYVRNGITTITQGRITDKRVIVGTGGGGGGVSIEDVRDIIGAALVAGNNIDVTVDDAGDTITIAVETLTSADVSDLAEFVRDTIGATLVEGANIDVTVSDIGDTITLAVTGLGTSDISNLAEFTRDTIGTALIAGNNIDITVDDPGNTITIAVESLTSTDISDLAEFTRDTIGTALVAGSGITVTVDDALDTITIASTAGSDLTSHLNDGTDAHDASAISVVSTTLVGTGTDVQTVLEELDNAIVAAEDATAAHLADAADAHDASAISILDSAADFTATDVEGALAELQSRAEDHLADTTDAHAASTITNTPAGTIAATNVQAALNELDSEKATTGSVSTVASDLSAHLGDATDAHDASAISILDVGNDFTAINVEDALIELQAEKEPTLADASETVKGKIELGTQAEVDTGTDAVRAITPATLELAKSARRTATASKTASFTLAVADMGKVLEVGHDQTAIVVTIPKHATVAIPVGSVVTIRKVTPTGYTTTAAVSIRTEDAWPNPASPALDLPAGMTQVVSTNGSMVLRKTATDVWEVLGSDLGQIGAPRLAAATAAARPAPKPSLLRLQRAWANGAVRCCALGDSQLAWRTAFSTFHTAVSDVVNTPDKRLTGYPAYGNLHPGNNVHGISGASAQWESSTGVVIGDMVEHRGSAGLAIRLDNADEIHTKYGLSCNKAIFRWVTPTTPAAQTLDLYVDDVLVADNVTASATGYYEWTGPLGAHTFKIVSTGETLFDYVHISNGGAWEPWHFAHTGYDVADFNDAGQKADLNADFKLFDFDVVIIELATNEDNVANWATEMALLLNSVQANTSASIVICLPPLTFGDSNQPEWEREAIRLANTYNALLVDLTSGVFPDLTDVVPSLVWSKSGTTVTITHANHMYRVGDEIVVSDSTQTGLPDGTYAIAALDPTDASNKYQVTTAAGGVTPGVCSVIGRVFVIDNVHFSDTAKSIIGGALYREVFGGASSDVRTVSGNNAWPSGSSRWSQTRANQWLDDTIATNRLWTRITTTATVRRTLHGLAVGNWVYMSASTDAAAIPPGFYQVATVPTTSTFTIAVPNAGATTGHCTVERAYAWSRSGSVITVTGPSRIRGEILRIANSSSTAVPVTDSSATLANTDHAISSQFVFGGTTFTVNADGTVSASGYCTIKEWRIASVKTTGGGTSQGAITGTFRDEDDLHPSLGIVSRPQFGAGSVFLLAGEEGQTGDVWRQRFAPGVWFDHPTMIDEVVYVGAHARSTANVAGVYANISHTLTASANAAFPAQDGVTLGLNDTVLLGSQTNTYENGLWKLTTVGSGAAKWVLTRVAHMDSYGDLISMAYIIHVHAGTLYAGKMYRVPKAAAGFILGVTAITPVDLFTETPQKVFAYNGDLPYTIASPFAATGTATLTTIPIPAGTLQAGDRLRIRAHGGYVVNTGGVAKDLTLWLDFGGTIVGTTGVVTYAAYGTSARLWRVEAEVYIPGGTSQEWDTTILVSDRGTGVAQLKADEQRLSGYILGAINTSTSKDVRVRCTNTSAATIYTLSATATVFKA